MSIRKKSTLIMMTSVVQLVISLLSGVIIAHFLGPRGKGIALLTFYIPGFLASIGSFSISDASTYYVGRGVPPRRVISNTIQQAFALGVFYIVVCVLLLEPLRQKFVADVPPAYMVAGLLTLPFMLIKNYGDGILVALDRVPSFVAGNLLFWGVRGVLIYVTLVVLHLDTIGAVSAEFIAWTMIGVFYLVALTRGIGFTWKMDWPLAKDQLLYSGQTHVGNMAMRGNHQVSTFFLSSYRGAAAVGLFSVAVGIANMLWYLPYAVGRILFPRVAGSSREEANALTAQVCRNAMFITALGCLAVLATARFVIPILYTRQFLPAVLPLFILMPGVLALTLNIVLSRYLSGIGKPYLNSIASVISFVCNLPLLLLLVAKHGLAGAAIATSLTYMVSGVLSLFFFVRESKTSFLASLVPTPHDFRLYGETAVQVLRRIRRLRLTRRRPAKASGASASSYSAPPAGPES